MVAIAVPSLAVPSVTRLGPQASIELMSIVAPSHRMVVGVTG